MKRKDLTAGEDYLFSTSADWQTWYTHTRVRVVTLDLLYAHSPGLYRWDEEQEHDITLSDGRTVRLHKSIKLAEPGTKSARDAARVVLVEMGHKAEEDSPNPTYQLVRLAQLRAPWQEGIDTVERLKAQQEERRRARAVEHAANHKRYKDVTELIAQRLGRKPEMLAEVTTGA